MQIIEQRQGAVTVLKPVGPLVQKDADQLKSRATDVLRKSLGRFVIDASAIAYADSRGLEVLVELTEELGAGGQALKLSSVNETLREVLDLTELAPLFECHEDVNCAVRSFL
ncbi:MAG: STAS domain-containing protein [Phycisphaeraceae bacterium]|nr:STAS domain-containing protein [Phycisphaeraceae bacterium]